MASPYHFFVKAAFFFCAFLFVTLLFYSIFFSTPTGTLSCVACGTNSISEHRKLSTNNHSNETTNVSHIVFGIAGSAKTWNKRRPYNELWWQPNVTRGFVWLDEMPNTTWPDTSPPYKISANTSMFKYTCWYGSRSALRITRIVKESFDLGLDNVRWFVMGDDDSVFFVENLVMVLANYDHNQMYYIGDNSESVEQDVIHSYNVAYGGGGFAISYALAKELVRILDGCIDRYASFYGSDQKIQGCLSEIGVPLTKELGFHQADVKGNLYGLLAAHPVAPLVSLHHVDYVEPVFPPMNRSDSLYKLYSAFKTDPGRIVQHSFCYDTVRNWSVSVSWGYTIQIYPSLVTAKQLETTFQTFKSWKSLSDGPFTFDTRVLSPDPCERPVIYFLDRIERVGKGESLTTYKRYMEIDKTCYQSQYSALLDVQSVNVSASTLEPYVWKMAPRRQCCEIINGVNQKNDTVQMKIRSCKQFESVTPSN